MTPKLAALALAAAIVAGSAVAQTLVVENAPNLTYSDAAIRRVEVEGVHLGMTSQEAAQAMAARGFDRDTRSSPEIDLYSRGNDHLSISFARRRQDWVVTEIAYGRLFRPPIHPPLTASERAGDRQFVTRLFGQPTSINHYEAFEEFTYSPRPTADDFETVYSCHFFWECRTQLYSDNCPLVVRRSPRTMIHVTLMDTNLSATIVDFSARRTSLLRDRHFMERDLRGRVCVTMPIH